MLFDSHAHLNDESLIDRIEDIIDNAKKQGVGKIVCVGYDKASSFLAVEIAKRYEELYAAVGVHPQEAKADKIDIAWIEDLLNQPKVVAIGEIGLDYYWDKTYNVRQREVFIEQIKLANKHDIPIIIHMRDATQETYDILKEYKLPQTKGVMHCYSASKEAMQQFLDLGMYISLAGPVTFKNPRVPKEVAIEVPLDRLLIETDSPYLAPMPYRGRTNQPAYVRFVAEEIARLKGISIKKIEDATYKNACELFNIENNEVGTWV